MVGTGMFYGRESVLNWGSNRRDIELKTESALNRKNEFLAVFL